MRRWLSDVRAAIGPDVVLGLRLTPEAPILDAQGLSNLTFLVDEVGVQYFNWGTYFFSVQVRAHQRQSTTLSAQDSIWFTPLHATIPTTLHCFSAPTEFALAFLNLTSSCTLEFSRHLHPLRESTPPVHHCTCVRNLRRNTQQTPVHLLMTVRVHSVHIATLMCACMSRLFAMV
jgi:hypothetical protein